MSEIEYKFEDEFSYQMV